MSLRQDIVSAFQGFTVDGVSIPVKLVYYLGHGEPYVVYQETNINNVLTADNEILDYVVYYDFDVYSKGNYDNICEKVIETNESIGFMWQPSGSSSDLYDPDTGYYHKTLQFAYPMAKG